MPADLDAVRHTDRVHEEGELLMKLCVSLSHTLAHRQFIVCCRVHTFSLTKFNKIKHMMAGRR